MRVSVCRIKKFNKSIHLWTYKSLLDLDGQIERVFPHTFKMTETKAVVSFSMSASLPLTLIEQVPKGLYQATDWRDGGQSFGRRVTLPPPLTFTFAVKEEIIRELDVFSILSNWFFFFFFHNQSVQGTY